MRILLYSQFCAPEPIFKSVPFARKLIEHGHDVRILTGFPNYPGGRIYPGYGIKLWQRDSIDGIPILRTWLYPSHDAFLWRRMLNYLSFAASSSIPLVCGWRPDVVYVYNLITIGVCAAINRLCRGVPFVVDVTDLWPDSVLQSGLSRSWMARILSNACRWFYHSADRVVTVAPGARRLLEQRGVPPHRLELIPNWCDESALTPPAGSFDLAGHGMAGRFNIVYAGNLGLVQALDAVIDAAALVSRSHPHIQFVFMGHGVVASELREHAAKIAPSNTRFIPQGSQSQAAHLMQAADALLIHLKRIPLFEITIPSKTQAYLAMGKPILSAVAGDASDLVRAAQAGVIAEPQNPRAIADAAIKLASLPEIDRIDMGVRGREFYYRELSIDVAAAKWDALFRDVTSKVRH